MRRDSLLFGLAVLGIVAGLGTLLYGEEFHYDMLIYVGGVIVLFSVGIITLAISQMDTPEGGEAH